MYSPQKIADEIKQLAREKGVSLKQMLSDCNLGINFISQIANGNAVTYINLAKLADYLDVSIDTLLGRDIPDSPIVLSYNGSNPLKQEISSIITDILDSTDDTSKLDLLKNILIGFAK